MSILGEWAQDYIGRSGQTGPFSAYRAICFDHISQSDVYRRQFVTNKSVLAKKELQIYNGRRPITQVLK